MRIRTDFIRAGIALAGAGLIAPAHADYYVEAGGHVEYQDNLFRASQSTIDRGGFSASDTIYGTQANLGVVANPLDFDTKFNLGASYDAYQHNSNLNNFNYSASLQANRDNGITGIQLNGTVQRSLSSFGDLSARIRNIQNYENFSPSFSYSIMPDIRLLVTPSLSVSTSSASVLKPQDYKQYGSGIGLGYYSPTGNSIGITVSRQQTDGLHDRILSINGVVQNARINQSDTSVNLLLMWSPSPITFMQATISYLSRHDKSGEGGNYHGPTAMLYASYMPTSKLTFTLTAGRMLASQSYLYASALRTDYASLQGMWTVFDHTILSGTVRFSHRRQRFDPFNETASIRLDNATTLVGSAKQIIGDHFDLTASVGHDFRNSNLSRLDYRATYATLSLAFLLGNLTPQP